MSSPDVFLSSPRVNRRNSHATGASSPELPDLHELIKSQKAPRPPLKSGSKAAPIPEDALTGFTTARGLWHSVQAAEASNSSLLQTADPIYLSGEDDSVCIVEPLPKLSKSAFKSTRPRRQKQLVKAVPKTSNILPREGPSPRTPSKEQPWKKYRSSPRSTTSSQSGETFQIDAPPSAQIPVDEEQLLETESISRHFRSQSASLKDISKVRSAGEPLALEPAPLRRLDWTPPAKVPGGESSGAENSKILSGDSPHVESHVEFKGLLREYNCTDAIADAGQDKAQSAPVGLGKRKLIEPVLVQDNSAAERCRSKSPVKRKAPKKPRTITELATAAYRVQDEPEPPPPALLDYISVDQEHQNTVADPKGKSRPRTRRGGAAKGSKKQAAVAKPVLLSPGAALKHVANQDFVFGTSSQLAQEKSPTFLRTLHTAMRQSNEIDDGDLSIPINSDGIDPPEMRPRLWDAAARDADGELFDVEVINLVDASPTLSRIPEEVDPFGYVVGEEREQHAILAASASSAAEADAPKLALSGTLPKMVLKPPISPVNSAAAKPVPPNLPLILGDGAMEVSAEPLSQVVPLRAPSEASLPTLPKLPQPQRPAYETFTDAQLAKQVSKYGFKPVKRRATMIALLDDCWKSQLASGRLPGAAPNRQMATSAARAVVSPARPRGRPKKPVADSVITADSSTPAQITTPAKRPRGRPKKDPASPSKPMTSTAAKASRTSPGQGRGRVKSQAAPTATGAVLEIPDSESDQGSMVSVSRSASPEPMFSSPVARANLSIQMDNETDMSLTTTPTEQQASLFDHITKAVMCAPRSSDAANPTWYEKMLLYDPVVVEDLAAWLNSGQLTSVGCDAEVSAAEVKKWCESKSVCCLWRDTHRGKERKRY